MIRRLICPRSIGYTPLDMIRARYVFAGLLVLLSVNVGAQQQRDPLRYIEILESAERVRNLQVDRVVETLGVRPGDVVADVGSGSGLFTRPLAKEVGPEGRVYAIDIDPSLLGHVRSRALSEDLVQIKTVLAATDDPKIPEKVDLILLIDTLHHIQNKPVYLRRLQKYLKPNGRIAIIDFEKDWPRRHEQMRYSQTDLDTWMRSAGFQLVEEYDFISNNFFVIYGRPAP